MKLSRDPKYAKRDLILFRGLMLFVSAACVWMLYHFLNNGGCLQSAESLRSKKSFLCDLGGTPLVALVFGGAAVYIAYAAFSKKAKARFMSQYDSGDSSSSM